MQSHNQAISQYVNPRKKDYYDFLYEKFSQLDIKYVWDVGCATGDFGWYAPSHIKFLNTDIKPELIEIAKRTRSKSNLDYLVHDILNDNLPNKNFDAVCLLGIITAFNDPEELLKAACKSARYVVGHFTLNQDGWDMKVSHKRSSDDSSKYQNSYNIFSTDTIKTILASQNFRPIYFERFLMSTTLTQEKNLDELRSYHLETQGDKFTVNQLNILMRDYIVIAERCSND